jgi:CDGSH iron-sulfur domain-containing protein 3
MINLRYCYINNKRLNTRQLNHKETKMTKGQSAGNAPIAVEVEKDKSYYWCSCGQSKKQPFCDGSHKGTEFTPLAYTASETKKMFFCACKQTNNQPFCDGSHSN